MQHHDTIIIGGGQAGLALSHELSTRNVHHVILERGRLAERWRSERWDSLRLLTPNWMTRLPGVPPSNENPDQFRTKDELVELLEAYARSFSAPIVEGVEVTRVTQSGGGFLVATTDGCRSARRVVVATGHCGRPSVPGFAHDISAPVRQLHASEYRNPYELGSGGVLVVGAGASGIQIAAELREAGHEVVLATGRHARAVRQYRGRDIWWWLDMTGSLDKTVDDVTDVDAARRTPSLGLTGAKGGRDIDLGTLQRSGVRITGRALSVQGSVMRFDGNLAYDSAMADQRLRRLLDRFDNVATKEGLDEELDPPTRPAPIRIDEDIRSLDLAGFGSIIWATGYGRSYDWLDIDVRDDRGDIIQRRGVTPIDGLYVLGMRFLWTRGSHFIDRVGRDAEYVANHIHERASAPAVA